ncbi:hypothetical protein IRJ41_002512 [Triplophysa rosa]|uniref:Uncharacterized protein n=1 Tax=Triplophysa rosa TaxID=992332 RepID=A0A9W7WLM9_TRIRA|nr:hypothetical protein IRJ41_002512 [Triplophysa rosa]
MSAVFLSSAVVRSCHVDLSCRVRLQDHLAAGSDRSGVAAFMRSSSSIVWCDASGPAARLHCVLMTPAV